MVPGQQNEIKQKEITFVFIKSKPKSLKQDANLPTIIEDIGV